MKILFKISILILLFAGAAPLWAQSQKYVVSAELHISMTHPLWPDVFLNGHQIVDSQEHVFDRTSNIDQLFSKEQLCYFSSVNCLAIEVPQTLGSTTGTNAAIGLAYVLKVIYSDHTIDWITSDQGKTRQHFVKKNGREPAGWTISGFDDHVWALAKPFAPPSLGVTLINPQTGLMAKYFPTFKDNARVYSTLGEKMYFRRKYLRDVTAPPDCGEPSQLAPLKVQPMPKPLWTGVIPPTSTFTPQPIFTPAPTATPMPQMSTATSRSVWIATALATATPTPVWTNTPLPTATLRPLIHHKPKKHKPVVTMTPTLTLPTHTPTQTALSLVPVFTATAVVTAGVPQDSSMAATIVFAKPPVNINASFADGPGVYRLEIVDARGAHINTLYNEQVVLEKDTWIIWDGTNDQGQRMGYGNYQALLSKDGVLIEKIALVWITPWTTGFE